MFIIVCLLIGFIIGFISDRYLGDVIPTNSGNHSIISALFSILAILLVFIIGFVIHIIIHELGHLIFGLATGYSFVSFRIGSLTIIREAGKLKRKKYNIPGTAGQCLMMPPELKNGKYPFVIYNFGGAILNFIVSIISILFIILLKDMNFAIKEILIVFSVAGIFAALTNGIPFKIGGVANDAYNVMSIFEDEEARKGFYLQLRVNGLMSKGMRIKDMDHSLFQLQENSDITNPLNTGIKLMEYNWYLDNMDFESARVCIKSFVPYFSYVLPLYTYEINCERIFLELIGECNKDFIDRLYDKQLEKYIKASKYMMNKTRL